MESLGVIEKISEPTDWLNTLVVAEKPNGKLRICLDPRPLNKVIKREHFQLPTPESIMGRMKNANIFSKLDASSGYWQIKVNEESSKLLAFLTPKGRYKFKRMPFGIHSASEIFQAEIAQIINDIDGVDNMQDDIIVWGETKEEHNARLREVLSRIRKSGLKLNKSKCVIGTSEITFLGHNLSNKGIKPDPSKIEAIINMPIPNNKTELQRFLGMVNYLGKFIPNISNVTAPLRQLLQKDTIFNIDKAQMKALNDLKTHITSSPILQFYNPTASLRLRTDASTDGLGAMLEQQSDGDWHPIAYASRATTSAEKNYAPIESEALSIVFGCERFHDYLYGRSFTILNDHQPLKTIFSKPITNCPPRIQRFMLRLQRYDFELLYAPGKSMVVADTLSRAINQDQQHDAKKDEDDQQMERFVHSIISSLPVSERRLKQIREETLKDETLQTIRNYTQQGWPHKGKINFYVKPYFSYKDEIWFHDGILFKGQRIIVPSSLRTEILKIIHTGHFGIEKCRIRAQTSVFWPRISADITNMISNCNICLNTRNRQQRETFIPHEIPSKPWLKVGTDLFTLYNKDYVLVVDYYSKFVEIAPLKNTTTANVINALKKIFSRHGIPKIVFSDNGPQYSSYQFKQFAQSWDFTHQTSSPNYPQSNGLAERNIQTVKQVLKKSREEATDPYTALLVFNTTSDASGNSPAFRLMGRNPRTTLPSIVTQQATNQVRSRQRDQGGRDLPAIPPKTTVRIQSNDRHHKWVQKGMVLSKRNEQRSYNILNEKGNTIRRNRRQLIPTSDKFQIRREIHDTHDNDIDDETSQHNEVMPCDAQKPPINQHDDTQNNPINPQHTVTRYGRVSKPPERLKY